MIIGHLQPAVVEDECLARTVLEIELAIVGDGQMFRRETLGAIEVERAVPVEEAAGIVGGHACPLSATPPLRTKRRSQ